LQEHDKLTLGHISQIMWLFQYWCLHFGQKSL